MLRSFKVLGLCAVICLFDRLGWLWGYFKKEKNTPTHVIINIISHHRRGAEPVSRSNSPRQPLKSITCLGGVDTFRFTLSVRRFLTWPLSPIAVPIIKIECCNFTLFLRDVLLNKPSVLQTSQLSCVVFVKTNQFITTSSNVISLGALIS